MRIDCDDRQQTPYYSSSSSTIFIHSSFVSIIIFDKRRHREKWHFCTQINKCTPRQITGKHRLMLILNQKIHLFVLIVQFAFLISIESSSGLGKWRRLTKPARAIRKSDGKLTFRTVYRRVSSSARNIYFKSQKRRMTLTYTLRA